LSTRYEFHYDDVTVTSFISIRYGNIAVEIIPQGTAFCYSFSVGQRKCYSLEMRLVYDDRYFTRPAIHVWLKRLLMVEKVLLMRKNLVAMLFRRSMQRSQRSWKCLHEFGRHLKNETLMFDV